MSYDQTQRKYQRELGRVIELIADHDEVEQSEPTAEVLFDEFSEDFDAICRIDPRGFGLVIRDVTREQMLQLATACVRLAKRM